jgi:DNA-directed RNA polymerase I subunit RPA43
MEKKVRRAFQSADNHIYITYTRLLQEHSRLGTRQRQRPAETPTMSSALTDQPVKVDKEQRKKDKAKRKKAQKLELTKGSKKRQAEEVENLEEDRDTSSAVERQKSPAKRQRTGESVVHIPDSQQPSLPIDSPFHGVTASIRVSIPPVTQSWPLQGVCANCLSPLLLTYNPQLKGVIMAYNHPRLGSAPLPDSETPKDYEDSDDIPATLAQAVDEYAAPFLWITAHFLILRPRKGSWLAAHVNLQNESHVSLILWNMFNVSIEKKNLPKAWKWVENVANGNATAGAQQEDTPMKGVDETWGSWVNEKGIPVEGTLRFRIVDFDVAVPSAGTESGFMSVEGTLLTEEEEGELKKKEKSGLSGIAVPLRTGKKKTSSSSASGSGPKVNGITSGSKLRH